MDPLHEVRNRLLYILPGGFTSSIVSDHTAWRDLAWEQRMDGTTSIRGRNTEHN